MKHKNTLWSEKTGERIYTKLVLVEVKECENFVSGKHEGESKT